MYLAYGSCITKYNGNNTSEMKYIDHMGVINTDIAPRETPYMEMNLCLC